MAAKTPKPEQTKETLSSEGEANGLPSEMEEIIEGLPEPQRKEISRIMTANFSMVGRFSPEGEVAKKITPEHITAMLNAQEKSMDYTYKENQHQMIFFGAVLGMIILAIVLIIVLLKENPDEMNQILNTLISAALGAAGGYGIGSRKRKDD